MTGESGFIATDVSKLGIPAWLVRRRNCGGLLLMSQTWVFLVGLLQYSCGIIVLVWVGFRRYIWSGDYDSEGVAERRALY